MAGIVSNTGHQFFETRLEPSPAPFLVNPGSLYAALDHNFSLFRKLVDRSVIYRERLNRLDTRVTLLAFPDTSVPVELHAVLAGFSRAEATELIGTHLLSGVKTLKQLDGYLLPAHNQTQYVYVKDGYVSVPQTRPHAFRVLNQGDLFKNGVVLVVDGVLTP